MKANSILAALLLLLPTIAQAEGAKTSLPFETADPNQAPPPTALSDPRTIPQQTAMANDPAHWDQAYITYETTRQMRLAGKNAQADAISLLATLRSSTLASICGQRPPLGYGGLDDPYTTAMRDMVFYYRGGRPISFLSQAAESALRIDEETPFSYRPINGWCTQAFSVVPVLDQKSKQPIFADDSLGKPFPLFKSVILKDPEKFWVEHAFQRNKLIEAQKKTYDALRLSQTARLPPFALGAPGNAGSADAKNFLALFRPTHSLIPRQDGEFVVGSFLAMAKDGSGAAFTSPSDTSKLYWRFTTDSALPMSSENFEGVLNPNEYASLVELKKEVCSDRRMADEPCKFLPRISYTLKIAKDAAPVPLQIPLPSVPTDTQWFADVIQYESSKGIALVELHSILPKVGESTGKDNGEQAAALTMPPPQRQRFFVLDLVNKRIVRELNAETFPEMFAKTDRRSLAMYIDPTGNIAIGVVRKTVTYPRNWTGDYVRLSLATGQKVTKPLEFAGMGSDESIAKWAAWGIDVTPVMKRCSDYLAAGGETMSCLTAQKTPDGKFWLMRASALNEPDWLVLVTTKDQSIAGALRLPSVASANPQAYAERTGTLLVRLGPNVQVYQY